MKSFLQLHVLILRITNNLKRIGETYLVNFQLNTDVKNQNAAEAFQVVLKQHMVRQDGFRFCVVNSTC